MGWECASSLSRLFSTGDVRVSRSEAMSLIKQSRGEVKGQREWEDYQAERKQVREETNWKGQ